MFFQSADANVVTFTEGRSRQPDEDFLGDCGIEADTIEACIAVGVRHAVAEVGRVNPALIRADDVYPETLGILPLWDDMDWVALAIALQEQLGIDIPDKNVESLLSNPERISVGQMAADVVDYVQREDLPICEEPKLNPSRLTRPEVLVVRAIRSSFRELTFVLACIVVSFGLGLLGHFVAGPPGLVAGLGAGMVIAVLPCVFVLRYQMRLAGRVRSRESEARCEATVAQRFRRTFVNAFSGWAGTWLFLWIAAIVAAFVNGEQQDAWFMLSVRGLLTGLALIGAGLPLALIYAGVACWFQGADDR